MFTLLWLSNSSSNNGFAGIANKMKFRLGKKFLGGIDSVEGKYHNLPVVVTAMIVGGGRYGPVTPNGCRITVKEPQQRYCSIRIKDSCGLSPFPVPQVKGKIISINKEIDKDCEVIVADYSGYDTKTVDLIFNNPDAKDQWVLFCKFYE